jgi:uncharacterized membrane protein
LLAALFFAAAIFHFFDPRLFLPIMPPQVPFPTACIILSGAFELLGAICLLIPLRRVQFLTGCGLTLLLIAVFPANVYMAVAHIKIPGFPAHEWMAWARLPLQPVLIGLVLWVTGAWSEICDKWEKQLMPR